MTTFENEPTAGSPPVTNLFGTECVPIAIPLGGGLFKTAYSTTQAIANFSSGGFSTANTWTQGQVWSVACSFTIAPAFASLNGYMFAHGAGVSATASTTIPMSAITGPIPAAQLPTPTASTIGGIQSSTAPAHQWVTGYNTSGIATTSQPSFTDLSGSLAFGSITGQIGPSQIANSSVGLAAMANLTANTVIGNNTGFPATPIGLSPSNVLDIIGATQGDILFRGPTGWTVLPPGTNGQFLTTAGPSANPIWTGTSGGIQGTAYTLLATLSPSASASAAQTSLLAFSEYVITMSLPTLSSSTNVNFYISINNGTTYTFIDTIGNPATIGTSSYGTLVLTNTAGALCEYRGMAINAAPPQIGVVYESGFFNPGAQINALKFQPSGGGTFTGTIKIYGR